jgi:hypothetical protein
VYKSKSSLLFFSLVLFAATAASQLQWGGARWGDWGWAVRIETRADLASLKDDARFVRIEIKSVPNTLRMFWLDFRSDALALQADAAVESRITGERLSRVMQNR